MSLLTQIATRYLSGTHKGFRLNLLATVSFLSVALGVFALVFVQSVMGGFGQDLQGKILRLSHPLILNPQNPSLYSSLKAPSISPDKNIKKIYPFFETEVILRTADNASQGIKLKAVGAEHIEEKIHVEYSHEASQKDFSPSDENYPGIVIGSELARRLNVLPELNEELELIYPFGEVDPSGEMRPKTRRFRVIGTFKTGYLDYDQKYALVALDQGRRLVPSAEVPYQWALELEDFWQSEALAQSLNAQLQGNYVAETWANKNARLFSALKLERKVMFAVLVLMIVIASFNLLTLTLMLSAQRAREIALLKVLGLRQRQVEWLFGQMGLVVGFFGGALGLLLSLAAQFYLTKHPFPLPAAYYLESLPLQLDPFFMLLVWVLAIGLAFFSSWFPARKIRGMKEAVLLKEQD
ncbi:MAG: ABC transporter permease [Deltaproteobacteria bacterium]|nr:ABC transporter permease [Deltaproteobacteria bacterium]